jgi:hypothetical protein
LAFVVYWSLFGIDRSLGARLFVAGVAYFATWYTAAWVVWARGARRGFVDRSPRAAAVRRWGWESAAARYRTRDEPFRPATASPAPVPAGSSIPWRTVVLCVLLFGGYLGYRSHLSDYAVGQRAGVAHVREMAAKGVFVRAGMNLGNVLDLIPSDPNASADWNAGFRAGFREELDRMYPQSRK